MDCKINNNIYLTGYMGTGKSTVGQALYDKLSEESRSRREDTVPSGIRLCDMDAVIEREQNKTVSEIFAEYGEEHFRNLETELLRRLSHEEGVIVSCGGGVPLREENARIMKESGLVIWLDANPETIYDRIKNDKSRPLLKNSMNMEHIESMMGERTPYYARASTCHIKVDGRSTGDIIGEILERLR